ncbi:hypothetical protein [Sphingomonas sp. M1-B02]|uniref:hypothetical protein n=1 Tax=Sphingomonas sp. M1-B02 TaxID=3114300 RepID=UPI00223FA4D5|nr:hypothetical protein [Sphingomonas sp. S6-11]UZK66285.1 hypothetical protein OKW87_00120 [Sphingomonas sp. S6-11]
MSHKTEALIREVAALFVKYRMTDWQPLIAELETRGGSPALANAIRLLAEKTPSPAPARGRAKAKSTAAKLSSKARAKKAAISKPAELELEPRFGGPHADTIGELRDALIAKRSFPAMSNLKAAGTALGLKGTGTSRRDVLVTMLTEHLDKLDEEAFERALRTLAREEQRSQTGSAPAYDRWFDLITAGRRSGR